MAFVKGNGGTFVFNSVTYNTITWSATVKNRLAETTCSAAAYATYIGTVYEGTFEAEVVWDDAQTPETSLQILTGGTATATLKLGASSKTLTGTAIIESASPSINNQQDAVKYKISGKWTGAITPVT